MKVPRQGQEESKLREIIARIINRRRDEIKISPAWVATEAMKEMDPKRMSPALVYLGCHLELRQIARSELRGQFEPEGEIEPAAQDDLFPELQWRYPAVRSRSYEEPEYVLREEMSAADLEFNLKRMRSEAATKLRHCDALEEWWNNRRQRA